MEQQQQQPAPSNPSQQTTQQQQLQQQQFQQPQQVQQQNQSQGQIQQQARQNISQDGPTENTTTAASSTADESKRRGRNIPVRAIHHLHQQMELDNSTVEVLTPCPVTAVPSSSIVNSASGGTRKNPSPVPIRKSSPRSSPRTSPLPHRGSSPAHGRSPSPHFNHRSSPRASPVSGGGWSTGAVVRNKSPHHHNTKLQTNSSAFNKVKRGDQQSSSSAFTGVGGRPSGSNALHVPLVLSSSGGASRNSWSPVMVSGIPRNLQSPKSVVGTFPQQKRHSKPIHQLERQDPTSRDLEFLMGSQDDLSDDPGFGSDNELIYYGTRFDENQSNAIRRRPSSSNSAGGKHTSSEVAVEDGRPKSCTTMTGGVSPVYDKRTQQAAQSPSQLHDVNTCTTHPNPHYLHQQDASSTNSSAGLSAGDTDTSEEKKHLADDGMASRGRTTLSNKQRWRSSSWDSLRSQQSRGNKNLKSLQQASVTRKQIQMQQQQKLQMQLQQHQKKHQMELLQEQQTDAGVSMEAMSGMSLEDVFKLERVLNSYKAQLLRDRVYATENTQSNSNTTTPTAKTTPPKSLRNMDINALSVQEYDALLENEFLVQKGPQGYAPPHPRERCNSGNCILDDMDDAVVGKMDFEDYEASYQFSQDPQLNGMRAPNFKMFKSGDHYTSSPISMGSSAGGATPVSVEDTSSTMEDIVHKLNEGLNNLSRSPGNISFISRAKLNANPPVARMSSPPPPNVLNNIRNSIEAGLTSPDPSKGIDCISSPRSAFSRANVPASSSSTRATSSSRPIRANSSSLSVNTTNNNKTSYHRGRQGFT